jgi:phosphatidyl-myo-inositol dimannoside synthase
VQHCQAVFGLRAVVLGEAVRILLLTTDAYGGHGGIALYNRDLAEALAGMPGVEEVVVVPRTLPFAPERIPDRVRFVAEASGGAGRYVSCAIRSALTRIDLVICGHINLLPLAGLLRLKLRCPLVLMAYGIDVWTQPFRSARLWLRSVSAVWTISRVTRDRMNLWADLPDSAYTVLPNAIHLDRYGIAPKSQDLMARYGLRDRKVIVTLARLPDAERYKGVDEVLHVLPALAAEEPTLVYLVAGDGDDRKRLEAKARGLGIGDRVVFCGFVKETEKADHFRLADVFAMPGRGEGFGFVFLEALACGVPVVGSLVDGSRDALLDGALGELVDPADQNSVRAGIQRALRKPIAIPTELRHFAWPAFTGRLKVAMDSVLSRRPAAEWADLGAGA